MGYFDENDFLELRPGAFKDLKAKLEMVDTLVLLYEKELGMEKVRGFRAEVKAKLGPSATIGNSSSPKSSTLLQNSQSSSTSLLSSTGPGGKSTLTEKGPNTPVVIPKPRILKDAPLTFLQQNETERDERIKSSKNQIQRRKLQEKLKRLSKAKKVGAPTIKISGVDPGPTNSYGGTKARAGSSYSGLSISVGKRSHGHFADPSPRKKVNTTQKKSKLTSRPSDLAASKGQRPGENFSDNPSAHPQPPRKKGNTNQKKSKLTSRPRPSDLAVWEVQRPGENFSDKPSAHPQPPRKKKKCLKKPSLPNRPPQTAGNKKRGGLLKKKAVRFNDIEEVSLVDDDEDYGDRRIKSSAQISSRWAENNLEHRRAPDYLGKVGDKFEWHHSCICGNRFLSMEDLTRHLKDRLFGTLYDCREQGCSKSFSSFGSLKYHSRVVHKIEILEEDDECVVCKRRLNEWHTWEDHQDKCPFITKTLGVAMGMKLVL